MKLIFKSLINNEACIDGGRKRKWWISIILVLISLIFAVIPSFVTSMTTKGSSNFTSSSTFMLEYGLNEFTKQASEKHITFTVKEDKTLEVKNWNLVENDKIVYNHETYTVKSTNEDGTETSTDYQIGYDFYYVPECTFEKFDALKKDYRSLVIFSDNAIFMNITKPYSNTSSELVWHEAWKKFDAGYEIISSLKGESPLEVREKMIPFLDEAFKPARNKEGWVMTGIYTAINFGVTLLMGLMIFILTRGKNNPYRMYTFFDGMKISFWCSVAPAILTIPLGFLLKGSFGQVMFPLLLGIRVMWLTMKSLRPDGTGYADTASKEVKTTNVK